MGTDKNQSDRKPRARKGIAEVENSPFRSKERPTDRPCLSDVPGVLGAIEAVLEGGRAIMLSRTSDGGAFAVHILDNGQRYKQYASSQNDLDELFADLAAAYGENSRVP